jgi:hypothetical protein
MSLRPRRLWFALAVALAVASPALPGGALSNGCPADAWQACPERTGDGQAFLAARVTGGTHGFALRAVGGPVLASLRADEPFYPASSIKVLHHLHAVRWVAAQPDPDAALDTAVPVSGDPCRAGSAGSVRPLRDVLWATMQHSDNLTANALADFFGRDAINETAAVAAGTGSGTLLAHRFACGGPSNDPANRATAADLAGLYARYGAGDLLAPPFDETFASFMLGPSAGLLERAIAEQAAALGVSAESVSAFRAELSGVFKEGWWERTLSVGGYVALPTRSCSGTWVRGYAFAAFVEAADWVASDFWVVDVPGELLGPQIRAALASYAPERPWCLGPLARVVL